MLEVRMKAETGPTSGEQGAAAAVAAEMMGGGGGGEEVFLMTGGAADVTPPPTLYVYIPVRPVFKQSKRRSCIRAQ